MEKHTQRHRDIAEGSGHQGGMGRRKWDENKSWKNKAIRFTRARLKNPLGYSLGDQKIPEVRNCKYLRIIL